MKRQTAKLSEQPMRFFTPELYLQFNSPHDDVADRADEAWEDAIKAYKRHLAEMSKQMTAQVKKVAATCFHDAEILACDQVMAASLPKAKSTPTLPHWPNVAVLSLQRDGEIASLIYFLWDRMSEHPRNKDWPYSKARKHWLYDELDLVPDRQERFIHRILFSDGTTLEIPFFSVVLHRIPLPSVAKQIA